MRRAVTLLELVLVIVIVGILAKVGVDSFRPDTLRNDARYIASKIRHAQYRGIGYDHRDFNGSEVSDNADIGCITLDKEHLDGNASRGEIRYAVRSELSGELAGTTLCFDHLGQPGQDDHSHPFHQLKILTLKHGNREANLSVLPLSGYVIISN